MKTLSRVALLMFACLIASPAVAGGKGAALAKLAAAFPVPDFFVIPAEAFDESGLKPEAASALAAALATLGAGPFAVRSSGREEDGADSAHAGQFETELNVAAGEVAARSCPWRHSGKPMSRREMIFPARTIAIASARASAQSR